MTMRLFNGADLIYTDAIIVGGAAQSIGWVARTLADIVWNFDLDTLTLNDFDNDLQAVQEGASGLTYNAYTASGPNAFTANHTRSGCSRNSETAGTGLPPQSPYLLLQQLRCFSPVCP